DEKEVFDGTRVVARHILISVTKDETKNEKTAVKRLKEIRDAINKEVDDALANEPDPATRATKRPKLLLAAFEKQAKDNSDCPSKAKGGELGAFPKSGVMVAPFADAAFKLKPNEMSDPVKTQFGYHLILCVGRKAGQDVKFEQIKDVVKEVFFDRLLEST